MRAHQNWIFGLVLIVATLLAYQPAWRGKLIWDDDLYLKRSHARSLFQIWTEPKTTQQYHPLVDTVFWVEDKLWNGSLLGHHLFNILIHACSALLLFKILRQLDVPGSWLAAGIFALHPVQVESVAWLVELKNTLSGFLFFAAMLAYLRFDRTRSKIFYALVLVLFGLGLATKTIIALLPVAVLIVIWWRRGRLQWKSDLPPLVPFAAIGVLAGFVTAWMERKFSGAEGAEFQLSALERLLIAGRAFWFYLAKLFWPVELVLIYPRWSVSSSQWWQYIFLAAAFLLFVALWRWRSRNRAPFAGLFFFAALLFPMLGFFNVYYFRFSFVADHFQYLPSVGIFTLVSAAAGLVLGNAGGWQRRVGYSICGAILILLGTLTWRQSHLYQNAETAFRDVVSKNPGSPTGHNNLGDALAEKGALDAAITEFQRTLELEPDYTLANYNLGAALLGKGDAEAAIPHFRLVLNHDPNHAMAYYNLANALSAVGRTDEAIRCYERAIKLDPNFMGSHSNLGNAFLEKGDLEAAMSQYQRAVELEPKNPMCHYNLAVGFARANRIDQAEAELNTVLRLRPDYPDAKELLSDLKRQR